MHNTTLVDRPFSPSVLLPVRLSPAIVSDAKYQVACEFGYFECSSVVEPRLTWGELASHIVRDVPVSYEEDKTPLAICAGVVLGYLSALAVVNHALALRGVKLLETFINSYDSSSAAFLGGAIC